MRTTITQTAALALVISSGSALAQPGAPMPGSAERVEQAESLLPRVGTNETPVMPTVALRSQTIEPGLTEGHDWTQTLADSLDQRVSATTLAEGTFLLDRRGRLVRGPSDRLIFVPDHDQRQSGEGPMLIMPCSVHDQLSQSWTGQPVLMRGEVFMYHGRNYLLPAWFSLVAPPAASAPRQPAEASTDSEPPTDTPANIPSGAQTESPSTMLDDDPQIQALLAELEAEMPTSTAAPSVVVHENLRTGTEPARPTRAASTASGIREGTILIRRRGRLNRQTDGSWALIFDNDEAADLGAEALTVLPCRLLMEMEALSNHDGGVRELIVSGRVYASDGDGYLLPTLIQRVRPQGITPRQ